MYITIKFKRDEGITKESIKVGDCFAGHHKSIYFQGIYKMTVLEINRARVKMKSQLMFVEDGGESILGVIICKNGFNLLHIVQLRGVEACC